MDSEEKIKKERAENVKEMLKPIEGRVFLKMLKDIRDKCTNEQKEKFSKDIEKIFEQVGRQAVLRAIDEKLLTDEEFKTLKIPYTGYASILQAYYNKKDFEVKEEIVVVTTEETAIYKHKYFIKERFGVTVKSAKEAIEMLKKK